MSDIRLIQESPHDLRAYAQVPIAFEVRSRVDLQSLVASRGLNILQQPVAPRWKDYDLSAEDNPANLPERFDVTKWGVFAAFASQVRVGGALVALKTPGLDMLVGRDDLAVLLDIRVQPDYQAQGIGRCLFKRAVTWAESEGCSEMIVETQDTNVAACRFYAAMGCTLQSADADGYGPDIPEAKLIWQFALTSPQP